MPEETRVHFNKQYLEEEIKQLAKLQQATLDIKVLKPIGDVLGESKKVLIDTYRVLALAAKKNRELSSAGEWLIDNFYIIQEQIVQLKEDLPQPYYKKLPRLRQGEYKGYPRTYEIIQMLAAISDNIIDQDNTGTAIRAYQEIDTLDLAEIWSVPLMIRLALIVRLTERSRILLSNRHLVDEVDELLNNHVKTDTEEPGYVLRKLAELIDMQHDNVRFLVTLAQRLQLRGMLTEAERRWFDYKFSRWDTTLEEQLRNRAQQTSRLHLSIQNAISSLRVISETDWSIFVESCSVVERILRLDPADMYHKMDFSTRDSYRKKIEQLSARSSYSEQEVAEQALMMAEQAAENGTVENIKKIHVGYYLRAEGYEQLAQKIGYKKSVYEWALQQLELHPFFYFLIIFVHFVVLIGIVSLVTNSFQYPGWLIITTLFVSFFPALELSIVSTNRLLSFLVPPRILPKIEFQDDIPHQFRTVVIVPTLLSSVEDLTSQFEQLEIRALANNNKSLQFVLLSDFTDAPTATMESDDGILSAAKAHLQKLNSKHRSKYGNKFLFFHRKRLWNASEEKWMGWERKRGKIEEFNRLLRNPKENSTFILFDPDFLDSQQQHPVQFIITLDADTKLPPGSAALMIGTAAHPLNRAEVDESGRFVKRGYGILQPRISIPPMSANKTWFSRIYSGNVGLDPYTTAVSDIYQDLFGEGVFTGKGLYDLKVFDRVLGGKFPENMILSHDLLESTYLRAGLITDIELFDDYPTTYLSYSKRNHRWIRGDWQILYWLFGKVPAPNGERHFNPINIISKWKILDNLRRWFNPVFLLVFLLTGWILLPGSALIWTAAVFGIIAFPIYSSFSTDIFRRPERVGWKLYLRKIHIDLRMNTLQSLMSFLFLPHQAFIVIDAVSRTLYRMVISHKNLLEWTSATLTEKQHANGMLTGYLIKMWANPFWGAACLVLVWIYHPIVLFVTVPISIGWMITPLFAYYLSKSPIIRERKLKARDVIELREYARRTWHFFERYMTEEHRWLPPDNVQVDPYLGAAARTSPTNIGLGLVSVCTAYEMGFITCSEMVDRLEKALKSMQELEKYKGHFYNWYSTRDGALLHPHYVSTVDSGNLAGSLVVVQQILGNLGSQRWPNKQFWGGLQDTLHVVESLFMQLNETEISNDTKEQINRHLHCLNELIPMETPSNIDEWEKNLEQLALHAQRLKQVDISTLFYEFEELEYYEWIDWLSRPLIQIQAQFEEIGYYKDVKVNSSSNYKAINYGVDINSIDVFEPLLSRALELFEVCQQMIDEMDFSLLYDRERELFNIGFNVERSAPDNSMYDLLASEARLASFLAIAKGEVPPDHWFRLSRRLTSIDQNEILISWGGTMFEYLMPLLFMSRYDNTMLSSTYDHVVNWQKEYGSIREQPWGFSESGYNILNLELHYQYRAFGVPGLGLRRGLAEDYVVAPYAGMLALMVQPKAALENLRLLREEGGYGSNGFYESIDYTAGRINGKDGEEKAVVEMYMAHHQGMSLLSIANVLYDDIIQRYFHEHPLVRSCELLLQERIPRGIPIKEPRPIDVELEPAEEEKIDLVVDHVTKEQLNVSPPRTHILSNGHYSTVLTHAGTGYSYVNDIMLTRWQSDIVKDEDGMFFYVRDLESGEYWSIGHQPVKRNADRYDSWYHAGKVQIARVDEWIESFMEVCVSPEDDVELRKISLTNYSDRKRRIEITSYAEIVLNTQQADRAHPAFSNLFVQTEYIPEHHAILAKRRPRAHDELPRWLVHTIASEDLDTEGNELQIETDRGKFVGRNRSLGSPQMLQSKAGLSGTTGNIRDPIVCIRRVVTLKPGQKKNVTFGLGKVNNREEAIAMADRYDNPYATDRVFELAAIYGSVELEHIDITSEQAHYFQRLAGFLLFNNEQLRAEEHILKRNKKTQSELWSYSISGDVPILVYHISDTKFVREAGLLIKGHAFWRQKGLKVDLVFINDHPPSYIDELQEAIHQQIQLSTERQHYREKGGIFVLRSDEISSEDRILIDSVAHIVISGRLPNLANLYEQLLSEYRDEDTNYRPIDLSSHSIPKENGNNLRFFNGYGGFKANGKEYVIRLRKTKGNQLKYPPSPWINVIANPEFGFIASESGSDFTWSVNSRENKLTPWSNDAVSDPLSEALYLRDENEQIFWSPLPKPITGSANYEVRHGFGYSVYSSETMNIKQEVWKWVAKDDPIKIIRLRLTNSDLMPKHLSVFRYLDWVLGVFREESNRHVVTTFDEEHQAITAVNHYNNEFAGRIAFAGFFTSHTLEQESYTSDRNEFIGRNNDLSSPAALGMEGDLKQRFGAGFESCASSKVSFALESGETADFYFTLGEAKDPEDANKLLNKYRDEGRIKDSLKKMTSYWGKKLQRIQIQTPWVEFNNLANGWLQYQNIVCRMWARSGFYQAGGAFGFRDQLQDCMAACYLDPSLSREQILLHAQHQFMEGDVLHWWHPPTDRGIRSRITDDLLWLPYVTAFYLSHTGDQSILNEQMSFITARQLQEKEHEAYLHPELSSESASLFEHCCRTIDRSLTAGPHGLPLIGAGDWNDGMNNIGIEGKGESVWLGFFLYDILGSFIPICKKRKDVERIEKYQKYRKELRKHLNKEGWDGKWYRRAYYDDGTPVGSAENEECRIDAIAQSWAIISGAGTPQKCERALESANEHLVSEQEGIIRLLTPAFDKTEKNPGYIKGYIPGVRENGGQYTHAALWLIKAIAEHGNRYRAAKLLQMLLPVTHATNQNKAEVYQVEPYAVAADIYGEGPLTGMGGWTWYTGSAGWMYRVMLESVLGFNISDGKSVEFVPLIIKDWKKYSIEIRTLDHKTTYHIEVLNPEKKEKGVIDAEIDGKRVSVNKNKLKFTMANDGKSHKVRVVVSAPVMKSNL